MAMYRTCPYCGANLDPGERCDCIAAYNLIRSRIFSGSRVRTGGARYVRQQVL